MNFDKIAAVSGKGGLYKVLNMSRSGVILESLDGKKSKLVVGIDAKVSMLSEISIYTLSEKGDIPLEEVMHKIHEEFEGDTGIEKNSPADELKSFLSHVLPDYDEEKVYVSDIKKLVNWYNILSKDYPEIFDKSKEGKEELTEETKEKE